MRRRSPKERHNSVYEAILDLENLEDCIGFFKDICSETELQVIEQRFAVANLLEQDKVYSEIISRTGASAATISRVNRVLGGGTGKLEKYVERYQRSHPEENEQI